MLLEQGWFKVDDQGLPLRDDAGRKIPVDPRVHCTAGDWSIRQTLAFCQEADLVIGPETGVLNAVCIQQMPKIVFLSHSSEANLTRDWVNTYALAADNTHCPGRGANEATACHQLHYGWDHCKNALGEDGKPTGIAQCQIEIGPERVYQLIERLIESDSFDKEF